MFIFVVYISHCMENTLIDNSTDALTMYSVLKDCICRSSLTEIKIATGYWDLKAMKLLYKELKVFLDKGGKIKLMIGEEPIRRSEYLDAQFATHSFPDFYIQRDVEKLSDDYIDVARLILDYCSLNDEQQSQFQIRVYGQCGEEKKFLHAKCYIFLGDGFSCGIIGSSNFTKRGLEDNQELNQFENESNFITAVPNEHSCQKGHNLWFDEKWNDEENCVAWNGKFINEVLLKTKVGKKAKEKIEEEKLNSEILSPYETYIKYLQLQFGDIADANADTIIRSYLPKDYDALSYQLDAVKQCFFIMKQHGGFILADVVGLGKTVVGILLIKKFISEASTLEREPKVLIVTPPAIKKSWEDTIKKFDEDATDKISSNISFVTTGSIGNLLEDSDGEVVEDVADEFDAPLQYDNYGLIIVDESHNFRNSGTEKYNALDDLIGQIAIRTGVQPYVGLLSATPQNNSPADLKNQIYLFQRDHNSSSSLTVNGGKLDSYFADQQRIFDANRDSSNTAEGKKALEEMAESIRSNILDFLMVRRTRSDIKNSQAYQEDGEKLHFPTIKGPVKLEYTMNAKLANLFAKTVKTILPPQEGEMDETEHISFARYAAICYFKDKTNTDRYEKHNTVETITKRLSKIMQILLVKRLESSFDAFRDSLENLARYTDNMIAMLDADTVFICPDDDVNLVFKKQGYDIDRVQTVLRDIIRRKGGNNIEYTADDFKDEYREALEKDKRIIDELVFEWETIKYDPKFDKFKTNLETSLFNKEINNPKGKDKPRLVIFTEAIATQNAIVEYLNDLGSIGDYKLNVLSISAKNRKDKQDVIYQNFDANCKAEDKRDDYNIIVTTEVLAEGVNLHRSNVILNYDTPWNATRLMQRIGRVNRIGSQEEYVYVFNFYPSAEGNEQINLIQNAYAKLQAFHTMFGEDNKVFSEMEELSEHELNDIIDGEKSPFEPFISEMKMYQKENPKRYEYISSVNAENLGGRIYGSNDGVCYLALKNNKRSILNICVDADCNANAITPLEYMTAIKCSQDCKYEKDFEISADVIESAKRCYSSRVTRMLVSADSNRKQKEALEFVQVLYDNVTTRDAKNAIKAAKKATEGKNDTVVNKLLEFKRRTNGLRQLSIFGNDFDVNEWATNLFGRLASQIAAKEGETKIVIYESK